MAGARVFHNRHGDGNAPVAIVVATSTIGLSEIKSKLSPQRRFRVSPNRRQRVEGVAFSPECGTSDSRNGEMSSQNGPFFVLSGDLALSWRAPRNREEHHRARHAEELEGETVVRPIGLRPRRPVLHNDGGLEAGGARG